METPQDSIVEECARGALRGELSFPEILARLGAIGVERYHADYSRHEVTYYWPEGRSVVVESPHLDFPISREFSANAVEAAVRQSQRNEHSYLEFVRKTSDAGCVGYFVQLTGRRVIYFGRAGESHTEHFPTHE